MGHCAEIGKSRSVHCKDAGDEPAAGAGQPFPGDLILSAGDQPLPDDGAGGRAGGFLCGEMQSGETVFGRTGAGTERRRGERAFLLCRIYCREV